MSAKYTKSTTILDVMDDTVLINFKAAIPYQAGKWDAKDTYIRTVNTYPIVQDGNGYYFLAHMGEFTGGLNPTAEYAANAQTSKWKKADNFQVVMADITFSKWAKMGSFVFDKNRMMSSQGSTDNYTDANFIPNFEVDGATGLMKFGKNIQFGLKNGYAVMEYYDNDGNLLYDLGPGGISKVEVREEKWVEVKLVYLGSSFSEVVTDYQIKTKYKTPDYQNETTFYRYVSKVVAGQNQDPTNDGKIFKNNNKSSGYITAGVYMNKTVGMQMEMLTKGTGTRIYPSGIQPDNEGVFDRSPLYYVKLMYYAQGAISSTAKAYWNPGLSPS